MTPQIQPSFFTTIKRLGLSRKYFIYSALYGITTLIVPLAVQFLVNNLALSGLWLNIISFMAIIAAGLSLSLLLNYCQIILNEFLQRELFFVESRKWKRVEDTGKRKYYIEVFFAIKSYSKAFTIIVDVSLTAIFGLLMMITFHPGFLILAILIIGTLYQIRMSTRPAVETAIKESDEKYNLFRMVLRNEIPHNPDINAYLKARDDHFWFIKRNSIKLAFLYMLCQLGLIGGGTYLVQAEQLSVGELVSAEIILSGIMFSLTKLPSALEGIYDYETSIFKLKRARGELHE